MDELANFKFAPPGIVEIESELLKLADVVFAGGRSLFESKRHQRADIHLFASSVDRDHFEVARSPGPIPIDLMGIPSPRLGFYGVVDERMDLDLIRHIASERANWSIIILGPVAKIDVDDLPTCSNIFYLGYKRYKELPDYLRHWDVALMPFALNLSTCFISPTKTPEYLAAGKPVVSTPIADVVHSYGGLESVQVADTPERFVAACEAAMSLVNRGGPWLEQTDSLLAKTSWDTTFNEMRTIIQTMKRRNDGKSISG